MAAELEIDGDSCFERAVVELFEPRPLRLGEGGIAQLGQDRARPEGERFAEVLRRRTGGFVAGALHELDEALQVKLAVLDEKEVTGPVRDDAVGSEQLPEGVHGNLQRVRGRLGRTFPPERVDQAVARQNRVGVKQQEREECSLTTTADRESEPVSLDLERTEQPEHDARRATPLTHRHKPAVSKR
jgi:hypothetical protein